MELGDCRILGLVERQMQGFPKTYKWMITDKWQSRLGDLLTVFKKTYRGQ